MPPKPMKPTAVTTLWLCMMLSTTPVIAAVITPAPVDFVLDGQIGEWKGVPPISRTPLRGRAPRFSIWLAQSVKGLVVAGVIHDPQFKFADTARELDTGGRLELWISLVDTVAMPPLTYTEQACSTALDGTEGNKAACLQWVKEQTDFGEQIEKLFTRMWRIAPSFAAEEYAVAAFDALTDAQRNALGFRRPSELPEYKFQTGSDKTISFEILVPWHLLPPTDRLSLERARLRLDIASGDSALATSDPPGGSAEESQPPEFALSPPITTRITPCGQPLLARGLDQQDVPAFYFLRDSLEVYDAFIFENPVRPYMPDFPDPSDLSPVATYQHFFVQELDPGEQLCGPFMSYRKGNLVKNFPVWLVRLGGPAVPVKRLADGTRLIRLGPDISAGPLWRRAWVVYSLRILALTPSLELREALSIGACLGGCSEIDDYEAEVSDDWRTVKEFRQKLGAWDSRTFCLTGDTYQSCGRNDNSPPPKTRR